MSKRKSKTMSNEALVDAANEAEALNEPIEVTTEHTEDYSDEPSPPEVTSESEPTESETLTQEIDAELASNPRAVPGNNADLLKQERQKLIKEAYKLGEDEGKGTRSLVNLAETVLKRAVDGAITPDHTKAIYEAFQKGRDKATGKIASQDSGTSKAVQVSKLNAFVRLGCENDRIIESDGFVTNAMDLLVYVREKHVQIAATEESKRLKYRGTYLTMLEIAVKQLNAEGGMWLTEDQINGYMLNDEKDKTDKTALDLIKTALETLEKARDGKPDTADKAGRAPLDHGNLDHAIGHLVQVISELAPEFLEERNAMAKAKADKSQ